MSTRYAIYFAPSEDCLLSRAAAAWLGRDPFRTSLALPDGLVNGFTGDVWRAATAEPRVYGFHATLKPPFRLSDPASESEFVHRLRTFAETRKPFLAPALRVTALSSFLALTLSEPCAPFEALAADCVREFDGFRAAPSDEELARRRKPWLSARQIEHLERWGYPYVLDEWRFHMTLTSSIENPLRGTIGAHLESLFSPFCRDPFTVDSICLFQQPATGAPFGAMERFRLS